MKTLLKILLVSPLFIFKPHHAGAMAGATAFFEPTASLIVNNLLETQQWIALRHQVETSKGEKLKGYALFRGGVPKANTISNKTVINGNFAQVFITVLRQSYLQSTYLRELNNAEVAQLLAPHDDYFQNQYLANFVAETDYSLISKILSKRSSGFFISDASLNADSPNAIKKIAKIGDLEVLSPQIFTNPYFQTNIYGKIQRQAVEAMLVKGGYNAKEAGEISLQVQNETDLLSWLDYDGREDKEIIAELRELMNQLGQKVNAAIARHKDETVKIVNYEFSEINQQDPSSSKERLFKALVAARANDLAPLESIETNNKMPMLNTIKNGFKARLYEIAYFNVLGQVKQIKLGESTEEINRFTINQISISELQRYYEAIGKEQQSLVDTDDDQLNEAHRLHIESLIAAYLLPHKAKVVNALPNNPLLRQLWDRALHNEVREQILKLKMASLSKSLKLNFEH